MGRSIKPMKAHEVIGLVPDTLLDQLADETGVDFSIQKLHGRVVFQLLIFALLSHRKVSLRVLAAIFESKKFQTLFRVSPKSIRHSALGMRLQQMDHRYFQKIFEHLLSSPTLTSVFFADQKLLARKIDSTVVTISSKLLRFGMENPHGHKRNIKFCVELMNELPVNIALFTERKHFSEDVVLPELVKRTSSRYGLNIAIFDRGIQKKKTFTDLVDRGIYFVTRSRHQFIVVKDHPVEQTETESLTILSDQTVRFSKRKTGDRRVTLDQSFRLIVGKSKQTGESLTFLTNVDFLSAAEVTDLYRSRWEIETFFKFIKQELNFTHLLSRTENGILSMMYLTMITAILLTLYKKMNKFVGWAVTKIHFLDELEMEILKEWHTELHPLFSAQEPSYLNSS